jgi:hypothetical protein
MAMNEPAGVLLVREALRERRFTDEAWSVLLPSLLRQARRMDRADAVLGWAETLLEQDRSAPADQTLRAWVDSIGGSGGRSRRGLEYALWLRARLALRGGRALPADLRAQYLEALRAFRFPYLDTPGRHQVRAAWETLLHAALAGDWVNVPPAAEALQGAAGILPVPEATDARRLAWLLEAAAARAHGQGDAAAERLARIAALYPLDPLPRLELLRSLAPATPAHAAHLRFLARLGPAPGANRPLHRLIALADPPGGPVRPWEAERF